MGVESMAMILEILNAITPHFY